MEKMQSVLAYLCIHYPYKQELSKARITKLVYLADWFSAVFDGRQMTGVHWKFNHYGPYVQEVVDTAQISPYFRVEQDYNYYGSSKSVVSFVGDPVMIRLNDRERSILDAVITKTKDMYFNSFIDYVYSTYPVRANERYSSLDLVSLASKYKNAG